MNRDQIAEVYVNGVRYVPARDISASVEDFKNALLDAFWGENYRGTDPSRAEDGLFVLVYDDASLGGEPFGEFIENLIAKLAARPLPQPPGDAG